MARESLMMRARVAPAAKESEMDTGFRQSLHEWRARPWVAAVAIGTLAVGMAGATTMFAVMATIQGTMVPPGVDADRVGRIVRVNADGTGGRQPLTRDELLGLRTETTAFESVSASIDERLVLHGPDGPAVSVQRVSVDFFRTLGFQPKTGRLFNSYDGRSGSRAVAIVSEVFLRRWPAYSLGASLRLGPHDYSIVGVLPEACWFPSAGSPDVWLPLETAQGDVPLAGTMSVIVRLRPDATMRLAREQAATIVDRHAGRQPAGSSARPRLITLQEDYDKKGRLGLIGILGPGILLLLIACANVANLLLARATEREQDMAVRAALGASRARLVCDRLREQMWLAIAAGLFGTGLAWMCLRVVRFSLGGSEFAGGLAGLLALRASALLFALAVTVTVPIVFGFMPAWAASRPHVLRTLYQRAGSTPSRRGPYGARDLLVIVEVGLAVVLVVSAAMFARFFGELERIEWGFDASRLLEVGLTVDRRPALRAREARMVADMVDAVSQVPGVESAEAGEPIGLSLRRADRIVVEFESCSSPGVAASAEINEVGGRYFSTMGLSMRRGRPLSPEDVVAGSLVGVVSQTHADRCWPGQNPIDRRFRLIGRDGGAWRTIVGVSPDVMVTRVLQNQPQPVYVPVGANAAVADHILVRLAGNPTLILPLVRAAVRRIDPSQPVQKTETLDQSLARRNNESSWFRQVLTSFGVVASLLGALGVFSVVGYTVAERTREFGIRLALGASRIRILGMVIGRTAFIVAIGSVVSLTGTLMVTHLAFRELARMAVTDPILWALVVALLAIVALAASIVPAIRATRIDPMIALRAE
jgi:putative ABC transport system permease protein